MPYRRRKTYRRRPRYYRRKYGRTRFRRARTSYRRRRGNVKKVSKTVIGPRGPVKDKTVIKLQYTDTLSMAPAGGSFSYYVYRGNSLFDPDFSGVGAQPYGFDQWAANYQRYRVIGSSISVNFMPYADASSPTLQACSCVVVPSLTSSNLATASTPVFSTPLDFKYLPYSKSRVANEDKPARISSYMPTGKLWGYNKFQIKAMSEFEASTVASPTREWFWHVVLMGVDTQAAQAYAEVKITYYAEVYQRVLQGPS